MPIYNPAIIRRYAGYLYTRAYLSIFTYTVLGSLIGFRAGLEITHYLARGQSIDERSEHILIITAVTCAAAGCIFGLLRSYSLRLKAQMMLCQVQIEENTRPQ